MVTTCAQETGACRCITRNTYLPGQHLKAPVPPWKSSIGYPEHFEKESCIYLALSKFVVCVSLIARRLNLVTTSAHWPFSFCHLWGPWPTAQPAPLPTPLPQHTSSSPGAFYLFLISLIMRTDFLQPGLIYKAVWIMRTGSDSTEIE